MLSAKSNTAALSVEVVERPSAEGGQRTFDYHIKPLPNAGKIVYVLMPSATLRADNRGLAVAIEPQRPQTITAGGVKGSFALSDVPAKAVFMFAVKPIDTVNQRAMPQEFVGVVLK